MKSVRIEEKGINITIEKDEGGIDTYLFVDLNSILSGKVFSEPNIQLCYKKFSILITGDISRLPESIEIKSQRKQYSNEVLEKGLTFVRKEKCTYKIKVSIPRISFLSNAEVENIKAKRKDKQKKGQARAKNKPMNCYKRPTKRRTNLIYSHSNVGKPYQGGSCTPK